MTNISKYKEKNKRTRKIVWTHFGIISGFTLFTKAYLWDKKVIGSTIRANSPVDIDFVPF